VSIAHGLAALNRKRDIAQSVTSIWSFRMKRRSDFKISLIGPFDTEDEALAAAQEAAEQRAVDLDSRNTVEPYREGDN
jgi:hypothetical protein